MSVIYRAHKVLKDLKGLKDHRDLSGQMVIKEIQVNRVIQ
jgi:hypothetical protein